MSMCTRRYTEIFLLSLRVLLIDSILGRISLIGFQSTSQNGLMDADSRQRDWQNPVMTSSSPQKQDAFSNQHSECLRRVCSGPCPAHRMLRIWRSDESVDCSSTLPSSEREPDKTLHVPLRMRRRHTSTRRRESD